MPSDKDLLNQAFEAIKQLQDAHDRAMKGWAEAVALAEKLNNQVQTLTKEILRMTQIGQN